MALKLKSEFPDAYCNLVHCLQVTLTTYRVSVINRFYRGSLSHLERCWFECEYLVPSSLRVSVHVDKNLDSVFVDLISSISVICNLDKGENIHSLTL